jgi:hypothetical protein
MQSTVIELSRYTSDDKPTNAEWTNRLSKPIEVDDGDYIMVKQAFIDTRLIDSNSILIEKDVQWTLQFMYWVNNAGINTKVMGSNGFLNPDGLPYVLMSACLPTDSNYSQRFGRPVLDNFTINIPAGIYERAYFAEFITRQLQRIKQPPNYKYQNFVFSNDTILPLYDASNNFMGFSKSAPGTRPNVVTPFQRPVYYGQYFKQEGSESPPTFKNSMFYTDSNYERIQSFFWPLTNAPNYSLTGDDTFSMYIANNTEFFSQLTLNDPAGEKLFNLLDGGFIGASEMSFVYNDSNGDNRFSFQYCHSPIINEGNESVGTWVNNTDNIADNNETSYLNCYSGIMFVNTYTNMSEDPKNDPFLKQLGFTYDDLVSPAIANYFQFNNRILTPSDTYTPIDYYSAFLPYTTRNMMTLGDMITEGTSDVGNYKITNYASVYLSQSYNDKTNAFFFQQSTVTEPIKATNPPTSSDTNGGHYLIDLQCSYVNEYVNQDKNYQIKGIISTFYLSSDSFTCSMGPDSYVYQHQGLATALSGFKIRILNPVTKLPADSLGPNSTIYLQITKEKPVNQTDKNNKTKEEKSQH